MIVALYLAAIVLANLSSAYFGPTASVVNAFLFIGLDLVARDRLHDAWRGKNLLLRMGALILAGGVISYLLNAGAGRIAIASCIAFAGAATLDAIAYHLLRRRRWMVRANTSNLFGAAADSLLFPTLAFGGFLPWIVLGQFVAKVLGGYVWSLIIAPRRKVRTA